MSEENRNWLDKTPIPALPWLTTEVLIFAALILTAIITRFYDLGTRVMSHDESLHTYYSWLLYKGQGYQHNPMMHGPLQFHLLALSYFIFGASDFTARIPAALFSIATVWALWYWRRYLGRAGVIAAGIMMVFSPYMLYYGRYVRNESFVALFGVLTLYAVLRYFETGQAKYLYLLTAGIVLHFTVKETAFIYTAELLLFLAAVLIAQITRRPWKNALNDYRSFLISLILSALTFGGAITLHFIEKGKAALETSAQTAAPALPGSGASPLAPLASSFSPATILIALGALGIAGAIFFALRGYGLQKLRQERSFDLAILTGTLILPMLSVFVMSWLSPYTQNWFGVPVAVPVSASDLSTFTIPSLGLMIGILAIFSLLSVGLGIFWNQEIWWKAALLFYAIFTVFYTTLFTNGGGFFTGLLGSLGYWLEQQGVQRGSQPIYYYLLVQIPVYEFLPALASLMAAFLGLRRLRQAPIETDEASQNLPTTYALLVWWSFASLVAFSIAGEKMPWLTVHITLPFILLGGWGIGALIDRIDWEDLHRRNAALILSLVAIFLFSVIGIFISLLGDPLPFQGAQLAQLQTTSSFLLALLGALASGYGLFHLLGEWDGKQITALAGVLFFGILAVLTARSAFRASYINYNSAQEYLVYAHSFTGVKDVLKEVTSLSEKTVGTPQDIVVAYDDDTSWPLSWYLRDFPKARYYGNVPDMTLREVPAIIVGDNNFGKIEPLVGDQFYRFDYLRMVWPNQDYFNLVTTRPDPASPFPADYSCRGLLGFFKLFKSKDYSRVCNTLGDPAMRAGLFDIWLNRDFSQYAKAVEPYAKIYNPNYDPSTYTDTNWDPTDRMRLYIRKDVADMVWNYGIKASELKPDPYAQGMMTYSADLMIGTPGSDPGQFNTPRGLAFAPDGSLYVADSRNNRIQHFSSGGQLINTWGTFADIAQGAAPLGTFNEPWGVAVGLDGSVYVTDTWNSRVQKFTADGQPVKAWGVFGLADTPGALYGPRGITVDNKGRIFVADTGNKRIVIYNGDGAILGQFGTEGYEAGQFSEPVDVKVDVSGNAYVTDTWNQRIQMLSPLEDRISYVPVAQWPVKGWKSQSLDNKPFIAVSKDGRIFISDPESYRVIEFNQTGEFIQLWGSFGTDTSNFGMPSGVACDSAGNLWVSDAGNGRIMRFSVPNK
jgi:uncharacterized protein (TIGR03663 family)